MSSEVTPVAVSEPIFSNSKLRDCVSQGSISTIRVGVNNEPTTSKLSADDH